MQLFAQIAKIPSASQNEQKWHFVNKNINTSRMP